MAEAAMSFAVEKLGDLAIQKVAFLRGVEGQVNMLKSKLEWMQCFLKDAAEKQGNDERVRKWISDIREVAQDAEDAIETFILKVETPKKSSGLLERCVCFPNHVYHLDRVGEEIESILIRLDAIDKNRQTYGIQNLGDGVSLFRKSDNKNELRRLSPWQRDKHIVGLEEDMELMLQKAILGEMNGRSVATIAGMGGLGKSTLAKEVYNHAAIAVQFDCRAWVCVSNEFNPKEIIKELLLQLVEPKEQVEVLNIVDKSPVQHLKSMLHTRLKGRRYFIVLDDVWHEETWESLISAFPDEQDKESRLLVTSRSRDTPRCARYVNELKALEWEKSWQLFLKKAFSDDIDGKCPEELEETGKEIVKKCYGLPLAITVVGGLLVKQRKSGWETVLKRMNSPLGSSKDSVSTILELSYHDLPPQLKSCFLCLGFFKEDATIRASKLVQLWIAEGLVPRERGGQETMEEIARSYLDELINRNMVQVKDTSKDDRVKTCYIHDLLRELSIRKAKEEIGFEILNEGNSQSSHKPRHRAICCSTYSGTPNKHIRSLFFHGGGEIDGNPSFWKSFDLLRLLDLEDFVLINLPDTIGALIGLRYLGLRNTKLKELPSSLGRLKNLQVLDITRNKGVKVPNILWKMDSLCHLYMSEIRCEVPLQIDSLKNLQTLTYISMDNWALEHAQLSNLCKLGIELNKNSDVSKLFTSLAILENLLCLNLRVPNYGSFPSLDGLHILKRLTRLKLDGILTTLPSSFPPNLSCLTLVGTFLDMDPMPGLEKLPKLLYLKFDGGAYSGEEMMISHEGFPRLKVLNLSDLSLKNPRVAKGAMPELKRLEIYKCPSMHSLPEELRSMTSLQELKMVTSVEIASKLRGEDSHIISNIPNINLIDVPYDEFSKISERQFVLGLSRWLDGTSAGILDLPFAESSVIREKLQGPNEDDRWISREFAELSRWFDQKRRDQKSGDL
ncbi:hypothetical protein BUALT_Bualt06G0012000 [Buddleja alternifolia]|uniref:Uncharacterized protein n=1 Tax=Buddleja alternifolia TaxID=168488 RepID=A0AAV6XC44_9LAMI|nr:hypothetical protein BUALT_Bualt06G0012000 [Buddleja alternifolia]